MTLRGFWGFDGAWAVMPYPEWSSYNAATGRDGVANHALGFSGSATVTLTPPGGALTSLVIGFALGRGTATSNTRPFPRFMNGTTTLASVFFGGASGNELVFNNGAADVAATSGLGWVTNSDHYLEIKYTPHATAGSVTIRVDEQVVLTYTGKTAASTLTVTNLDFIGTGSWMDDAYLLDLVDETATAGRANNDFLGDCKVAHCYPTSDGATVAWTPSTGTTHWGLVDENPVNTTDYVSAVAASGFVDLYNITDLPATAATVYGIRTGVYASKTDTGAAAITCVIRDAATNSAVGTVTPGTSYLGAFSQFVKTKPTAPTTPFTVADINALQVGVQAS